MHGIYWSKQLGEPYTAIPIAALEFIAALASILTFTSLLPEPSGYTSILPKEVSKLGDGPLRASDGEYFWRFCDSEDVRHPANQGFCVSIRRKGRCARRAGFRVRLQSWPDHPLSLVLCTRFVSACGWQ